MNRTLILLALICLPACESKQKTPTPPAIDLGPQANADAAAGGGSADAGGDAASAGADTSTAEVGIPPIAENLIAFIPETLDGVAARRRQTVKSAPIVHGFYPGEDKTIYNLHIIGPHKTEAERRETYPLLGKEESSKEDGREVKGLKVAGFEAQQTYNTKKKRSETVVLVNPFVLVKLNIAPTKDKAAATKLLEKEIDLAGVSKLR